MEIKSIIGWYKKSDVTPDKGQSLVEMAIILPILLMMMLGVFEVGWALRSYLVLANVNREITRFAARGIYLDFDSLEADSTDTCFSDAVNDPAGIGYCKVVSHTISSLSNQLNMDFLGPSPNSSIIITYYDVEPNPNFNCEGDPDCAAFDCSRYIPGHPNYLAGDDLNSIKYPILDPGIYDTHIDLPGFYNKNLTMTNTSGYTSYHYHRGGPFFSRLDPEDQVKEIRGRVNQLNCQLAQKELPAVGDNMVVIESIYNQNQLVGLPFVDYLFPNPIPFYTHTAMRVSEDLREAEEEGTNCRILPIIVPASNFGAGVLQGSVMTLTFESGLGAPGSFGFLCLDSDTACSQQALEDDLLAGDVFTEPDSNPADHLLNVGDWVNTSTGVFGSSISDELDQLISQGYLYYPVWDDCGGVPGCPTVDGTGSNAKYQISYLAVMKITGYQTTGNPKGLTVQFSHFDNNACLCDPTDPAQAAAGCDIN